MSNTVIKVSYGYTKNMGNFESQRLDVGVELPVNIDCDELQVAEEKLADLKQFVYEKLGITQPEEPPTDYPKSPVKPPIRRIAPPRRMEDKPWSPNDNDIPF